MASTSYIEPSSIRAGDTLAWRKVLFGYPAGTWTLVYTLINAAAKITITGGADGSEHVIGVAAATSGAYAAGKYDYVAHVTSGTERISVGSGRIEVLPNLAAATTYDNRSHARKMLEAIEALLSSKATADQLDLIETQFDTRVMKRDPGKLLALRDRYRAEVASEDRAERLRQGLDTGRRIQTRLA